MADLILNPSPLPLPISTVPPSCLTQLILIDIHNPWTLTEIFNVPTITNNVSVTHSAIGYAGPFHSQSEECITLEDMHFYSFPLRGPFFPHATFESSPRT
jgi:hypothetical protein